MKRIRFLFILLLLSMQMYSQQISGVVYDTSNLPVPGATVLIENTNLGTTTDFDGKFNIKAKVGEVIVVSYIGMVTQRVTIKSLSNLNVVLIEDATQLGEVIITAFGVKKETKSLGYSVQQIGSESIERSGANNVFSALQSSVAGLSISTTSGSAGGGSDILLRGVNSLNAGNDNQPLIIVDGLPINNDVVYGDVRPSTGSNSPNSAEQFAFSNRGMDVNPDDIENVSVLKGAAASALYGSRAANGVVLITTKKGKQGKPKINLSSRITYKNLNTTPELQNKYREGFRGESRLSLNPESSTGFDHEGTTFWSWGPSYDENDDPNFKFRNTFDDLFRTGNVFENNLSIGGGLEKTRYYFSVGNTKEEGIVPNTDYNRLTLKSKFDLALHEKVNLQLSVGYTKSGGIRANSGDKSIMSSLSFWSPSVNINDYLLPDGSQKNYTRGIIDNPRYFADVSNLRDNVDRWIAASKLDWNVKEWLNLTYSLSLDATNEKRNRLVPPNLDVGSGVGGFITNEHINNKTFNSNFIATFKHDFSENIKSTLLLGNQVEQSKFDYALVRGEGLFVPDFSNLGNSAETFQSSRITERRVVGLYADLRFELYDKLFLSFTGRNDWASTLPKQNRSLFYPSISASYVFNELVDIDKKMLSFGKIRASWAQVGKIPPVGIFGRFFLPNNFNGFVQSSTASVVDLKPEISTEFEMGVDLRFFKNRFRLDYSFYKSKSDDQILPIRVSNASSLSTLWQNAGELQNIGHELLLSADIIKNDNFKWTTTLNWSTNKGEVLSLPDDLPSIDFASSGFAGVVSRVKVGDQPGTLYGFKWREENGQRYIGTDGKPEIDLSEQVIVGNAFPDWVGTISNLFTYKNVTLSFLLEYKNGGDLYDAGRRNSIRNGVLKLTEFRDQDTVLEGVMDDGNGGFVTNTISTTIDQDYYRNSAKFNRASGVLIQDASWVKIRNVAVSYTLPTKIVNKIKFKNITFTASGSNFLLWTPFEGFDPEGNQYSAGSNTYGFTGLNIPLTQNYSFGAKLTF